MLLLGNIIINEDSLCPEKVAPLVYGMLADAIAPLTKTPCGFAVPGFAGPPDMFS